MPPTVPRHRPGSSFDELLNRLDENELHLLLTDLNNSRDVHIPVARAIDFYEKPRSRRYDHGPSLIAKRAVSSPFLPSSHYHDHLPRPRDATPPVPPPPRATITLTARKPPPSLSIQIEDMEQHPISSGNKWGSLSPLAHTRQTSLDLDRPGTAEDDAEPITPASCEETVPPQPTAMTSRAYKRISRPALAVLSTAVAQGQDLHALLAAHLFGGSSNRATTDYPLSLSSSRSMVDLRLFERQQQEEDCYRPRDVLEPMVSRSAASPSVLGKPLLQDATGMSSLFAVLNESQEGY
ncbi:hypothetical protein GQ53DRAFT_750064 [Thozetella sp. PMI_491]|nr:hypothetical protein GQ53DRAFT_750064 [Thozetella sp. PMI_491]